MSDNAHNNNTRWLIAMGITVSIALAGWVFAGAKAAEVRGISEIKVTAEKARDLSVQNDKTLAVVVNRLDGIDSVLQEIKQLAKELKERK